MTAELAIFLFGCFLTLFVGSAVGLLLWGAYREKDVE
jgi:hypothetical protein